MRGYKWLVHIIFLSSLCTSHLWPLPAQMNVEDFDFVSAVPHSNHHTVGEANQQNHDSSPPQSVIILHSNVCLGLSNPYISPALWRQCKSKSHPILLRGLGEAVVTNDWCIVYSLWCTSHEHLVLSHPKNIRWYMVQPISKHFPTPSLVSLSDLSIIFIGCVFFSLESHLIILSYHLYLPGISFRHACFALPGVNKSVFGINR